MFQVTAYGDLRAFLEGFTTIGGRLGFSALLVGSVAVVVRFVLPVFLERFEESDLQWAVIGAVVRTLQLGLLAAVVVSLAYVWGAGSLVDTAVEYLDERRTLLGRIVATILVVFLGYVSARLLSNAIDDLGQRTDWISEHEEEIVFRVSQILTFALLVMAVLGIWRVNLGGLLIGAGFLGIVVGFAARQTLGSMIAGFVLMFSRPFTIGDWVQVGDQEGIVTDITVFNTRLENFDGEFIVLPNDKVSNQAITNRSQKGLLRLRVDVGVDYDTDPERARDVALDAISGLEAVVDSPPPQAFPKAFGDSAVVLELRFWIDHPTPPRKWQAVSSVISAVRSAFAAEDIKIPFPQRELSGRGQPAGFQVQQDAGERRAANGVGDGAQGPDEDSEMDAEVDPDGKLNVKADGDVDLEGDEDEAGEDGEDAEDGQDEAGDEDEDGAVDQGETGD